MKGDQLAAALYDTPWLVEQAHLESLVDIFEKWRDGVVVDHFGAVALFNEERGRDKPEPYPYVSGIEGGVATMRLRGTMSPRMGLFSAISGGIASEVAAQSVRDLRKDRAIKGLILDFDSPGGAIAGVEELSDAVYEAREDLDITAIANYKLASAAYWVASQAHRIIASPSSLVGSIGTMVVHRGVGEARERQGVKYTFLSVPGEKTAANNDNKITDEGVKQVMALLEDHYGSFVSAIARGRGVGEDVVRDTYGKGAVFTANMALAVGMVDSVDIFSVAIGAARDRVQPARGVIVVAEETTGTGPTVVELQARLDAEKAKREAAEARADVATSANTRAMKELVVKAWDSLGLNTEALASVLVDVHNKAGMDVCAKLEAVFSGLNAQAAAGDLFKEVGKTKGKPKADADDDDPDVKREARIKGLIENGHFKTESEARAHVYRTDPDIRDKYRQRRPERKGS